MIPVVGFFGRRVGVLGLGRSGMTLAHALRAGGAVPVLWDDNPKAQGGAWVDGFEVLDLNDPDNWDRIAALMVSPGIPHLYPQIHPAIACALAKGVPIDNDIGQFFASAPPCKVVAVTGSNGKSTTTALIHHILNVAGTPCQIGGNFGKGVLSLEPPRPNDAIALELSSYQTELARQLSPKVAVFLNLSPDHLDRHGGMGGYFAAKRRLFELGNPEVSVIGVDEPEGRLLANSLSFRRDRQVVEISARQVLRNRRAAVFVEDGHLIEWDDGEEIHRVVLDPLATLRGRHNWQNACAAWAACRALGVPGQVIQSALHSFVGLAHRMEQIAMKNGVAWINDSKATNADAAEKALLSFERIRWIAGGKPKEGGIDVLMPLMNRVIKTYLIGEAAVAFARTLGNHPYAFCGTLADAVALAKAEAQPGETVLLSPACASFDQFTDYEARGEAFRKLVNELVLGRV